MEQEYKMSEKTVFGINLKKPLLNYSFEPKEDISAFELAKILPLCFGPIQPIDLDNLGSAQRHLRVL
jgi:hypothetical protein